VTTQGGELSFDADRIMGAAYATVRHLKSRERKYNPEESRTSRFVHVDLERAVIALVAWLNDAHSGNHRPYIVTDETYDVVFSRMHASTAMPLMVNRRPLQPGRAFGPKKAPRGTVAWSIITVNGQLLFVGILKMQNGQWELVRRRMAEDAQGELRFELDQQWYKNRRRHSHEQVGLQQSGTSRSLARRKRRKASHLRRNTRR